MDVPFQVAVPPPGTDDVIEAPGASKSRKSATLENPATASVSVVAATLMADEMQAGVEMRLGEDPFPLATIVATPTERKLSMASFLKGSSLSQGYQDFRHFGFR